MPKPSPYFFGEIKGGQWYFRNRQQFDDYLHSLPEGEYQISIAPKFKLRTTGQPDEDTNWNGYYWGVIIEILAQEMGLTRQDCHKELKLLFNPVGYSYKHQGKKINRLVGGSTQHMSDKRFKEYCYDIRRWAMSPDDGLNCYIPEPHESPEAFKSLMDSNRDYRPE